VQIWSKSRHFKVFRTFSSFKSWCNFLLKYNQLILHFWVYISLLISRPKSPECIAYNITLFGFLLISKYIFSKLKQNILSLQKLLFFLLFILLSLGFQFLTMKLNCLLLLPFFLLKNRSIRNWVVLTIDTSLFWWINWLCVLMLNVHDLALISSAASFILWPLNTWSILLLKFSDLIIMPIFQRMLHISWILNGLSL